MTRLIPKVMLFMIVVSLLFIATAAANSLAPMHYQSQIDESSEPLYVGIPKPHFNDYYDYVIERIQSYFIRPRPGIPSVAQIISGNFPGLTDGYNSDRLQNLLSPRALPPSWSLSSRAL